MNRAGPVQTAHQTSLRIASQSMAGFLRACNVVCANMTLCCLEMVTPDPRFGPLHTCEMFGGTFWAVGVEGHGWGAARLQENERQRRGVGGVGRGK